MKTLIVNYSILLLEFSSSPWPLHLPLTCFNVSLTSLFILDIISPFQSHFLAHYLNLLNTCFIIKSFLGPERLQHLIIFLCSSFNTGIFTISISWTPIPLTVTCLKKFAAFFSQITVIGTSFSYITNLYTSPWQL